MRAALWPEASSGEHLSELDLWFTQGPGGILPAALLVAQTKDGSLAGFLEVALRSHADGCDPAHPVGFIEGWFVQADRRGQGVGGALMLAAEQWARAQGAREVASDVEIGNGASELAHRALGFEVVDRCVHLRKPL